MAPVSEKYEQFVSAVVYIKGMDGGVERALIQLSAALAGLFQHAEVVCVNDSASEISRAKIGQIANKMHGVTVSEVSLGVRCGVERAMRAGLDAAIGDFVYLFEHLDRPVDDSSLSDAFRTVLDGNDIVSVASQRADIRGSSKLFYDIYNHFSLEDTKVFAEEFCVVSRRAINRTLQMYPRTPFLRAAFATCGLSRSVLEYPISIPPSDRAPRVRSFTNAAEALLCYTDFGHAVPMMLVKISIATAMLLLVLFVGIFLTSRAILPSLLICCVISLAFAFLYLLLGFALDHLALSASGLVGSSSYALRDITKLTGK